MNGKNRRFRFIGPLARVSNLDAVFFWCVYCLSVVLILWLFCTSFRTQLGFSIQQQILSLVQTVSSFTRHAPPQDVLTLAYLDVLPKQNPALKSILIVRREKDGLRILRESTPASPLQKSSGKSLLADPLLAEAMRQASQQRGITLSSWEFLRHHWNPFVTPGNAGMEVICQPLYASGGESESNPAVLVIAFDTTQMVDQFKNIDRIGSIMVSLSVLVGTVLAMAARWRGIQREQAIEERLSTLNLLHQRDRILAMVAAAADDLLHDKEPRPAIQKMMDGLCQFLEVRAAYARLSFPQEPDETMAGTPPVPAGTLPEEGSLSLETLHSPRWQKTWRDLLQGNYVVLREGSEELEGLEGYVVLFPFLSKRQLAGFVALHGNKAATVPENGVLDCLRLAADLIQSALEKQENEKRLLQSNKMLALGRMAGGVAHEFNNLLHIISGNLRRLVRDREATPEKTTMEKILHASDRGARIVQQLLSATRQALPTFSATSLNALVETTLLLGQSAFHKNIELRTHFNPSLPPLSLDEGQIQQVLLNLLINAEYAIREKGIITVTTGLTPAQPGRKTAYAFCEVRDSGEGIPREAQQHMFDPFFTTKPPGSGTGLGLPTSRGILESHGGRLEGRNHPSGGAVFTFYLPVPINRPPAPPKPEESTAAITRSKIEGSVWVADDEPLCREFLLAFLGEEPLQIRDFPSGDALLRHATEAQETPDWIITDWSMPGISGRKLVRQLRARFPSTPLVVTSGFALESFETEEVDAVVQKPFDPAEILALLAALRQGSSTDSITAS